MRILFVHLLNNYTGSPRVLSNFLLDYSKDNNNEIHLLTSKTKGCLSDIYGVKYHYNKYKWCPNKVILSLILILSQIYQFFFILFNKKYDCIYINTILPFGAAIAAKLRRERIIYHIHEYYPEPNILQKFCVNIVKRKADVVVFVSEYLKDCYKGILSERNYIVHNTVSSLFHEEAQDKLKKDKYLFEKYNNKIIVLPCALKKYKGVDLFLELATKMRDLNFLLVTSNSEEDTNEYFKNKSIPENFMIKNEIKNMGVIYSQATIVLNLSLPHGKDIFIETFCMGLVEAFEYKTPCIAPCYGGPLEIIENGKNGYLMEVEDIEKVCKTINSMLLDLNTYMNFCENAYTTSHNFSSESFINKIEEIISNNLK